MYGVKSSRNQSERRLHKTARISVDKYLEVNDIVQKDVFVGDCLSGNKNINKALERANQLELVLNRGGFSLRGVIFSGKDPPTAFSADDSSINMAGMKCFPWEDLLHLYISELNFAKKNRGKKQSQHLTISPSKYYSIKVNKNTLCQRLQRYLILLERLHLSQLQ